MAPVWVAMLTGIHLAFGNPLGNSLAYGLGFLIPVALLIRYSRQTESGEWSGGPELEMMFGLFALAFIQNPIQPMVTEPVDPFSWAIYGLIVVGLSLWLIFSPLKPIARAEP